MPFLPPAALQAAACSTHQQACLDQGGRWGRGREARAEGQDSERIQGNVLHTAAVNGSIHPTGAEWDRGQEVGTETG